MARIFQCDRCRGLEKSEDDESKCGAQVSTIATFPTNPAVKSTKVELCVGCASELNDFLAGGRLFTDVHAARLAACADLLGEPPEPSRSI